MAHLQQQPEQGLSGLGEGQQVTGAKPSGAGGVSCSLTTRCLSIAGGFLCD